MTFILNSYKYVSFDLFDTLIVRNYFEPSDVFINLELMAKHAGINVDGFSAARIEAELNVRQRKNFSKEVTLNEIYAELENSAFIDKDIAEWLKNNELSLELACIVPNARAVKEISEVRRSGKKVIFITDIYLPKNFIEDVLSMHNIMHEGDELFVSSEIGLMKSNGELFEYVLGRLNLVPSEIVHYGDNFVSDVEQPNRFSIRSVHYKKTERNRYELCSNASWTSKLILGVSRSTRLSCVEKERHLKTIWETTSNVSAPMIFVFVSWTIQEALKKGLGVIYYFSRDGQILHKIATKIVEAFYSDRIQVKYLYVSRQALLFPAIYELTSKEFEWILAPTSFLSAEIIFKRINLNANDFRLELEERGVLDLQCHLTDKERLAVKDVILLHEKKVLAHSNACREKLIGYLSQEGVLECPSIGVVDIGWGGTLQYSISKILNFEKHTISLHGFYFGIRGRKLFSDQDSMDAWFTDHHKNIRELDKQVYIVPMTELFTMADHGGTDTYELKDGQYHPVLREDVNSVGQMWGVGVQHQAMILFSEMIISMLRKGELESLPEDFVDIAERNFRMFLLDPTFDEAKAYCKFNDSEDQSESYYRRIGNPYSYQELKRFFSDDFMHHHNEWRQGALKLSNSRLTKWAYKLSESASS